jgi:predicted nucleic acid-binding protein
VKWIENDNDRRCVGYYRSVASVGLAGGGKSTRWGNPPNGTARCSIGGISATIYRMTHRIVVDTNIFVGACLGQGAAHHVVAACLRGQCQPLMGAALFAEYEDVLGRTDLFEPCRLTPVERDELLDIFLATCMWTRIYFAWRPNLPDEADNHLVELAVAGGARFIVTRNLRDIARMELKFPELRVVSPEDFLKEIAS